MSRFPNTVNRYMSRNSPKRMYCNSGSSERATSWNSETSVRFCDSAFFGQLLTKEFCYENKKNIHPRLLSMLLNFWTTPD
jgi:hypothetical protein